MISKVGYADNRTSFGATWRPDKNRFLNKLFDTTVRHSGDKDLTDFIRIARELRTKTPNHKLEIENLDEGNTLATVRNNATGAVNVFKTEDGLHSLLLKICSDLIDMAKKGNEFWN